MTITGADDGVDPRHLVGFSAAYPFVEWGVLLSRKREGTPRYPTRAWVEELQRVSARVPELRVSGHLCGTWARDLALGERSFEADRPTISTLFRRVQLNLHAERRGYAPLAMADALRAWGREEYILPAGEVNDGLISMLRDRGVRCATLFDGSGGRGLRPAAWPIAVGPRCGYAGGLHPDLLARQLGGIAAVAGEVPVWIDVESNVRTADGMNLDFGQVEQFLRTAAGWVAR